LRNDLDRGDRTHFWKLLEHSHAARCESIQNGCQLCDGVTVGGRRFHKVPPCLIRVRTPQGAPPCSYQLGTRLLPITPMSYHPPADNTTLPRALYRRPGEARAGRALRRGGGVPVQTVVYRREDGRTQRRHRGGMELPLEWWDGNSVLKHLEMLQQHLERVRRGWQLPLSQQWASGGWVFAPLPRTAPR
jgi:hypothetical protein